VLAATGRKRRGTRDSLVLAAPFRPELFFSDAKKFEVRPLRRTKAL